MRIVWIAALVILSACTSSGDAVVSSVEQPPPATTAPPTESAPSETPAPRPPPSAVELRDAMRRVFRYEVSISHSYLIATTAGHSTSGTATRMTKNEDDLGTIFTSLYGAESGGQIAAIFRAEGDAVRSGFDALARDDSAALAASSAAWSANMAALADSVGAIVPKLERSELKRMFDVYNEKTYGYAAARRAANDALESVELDSCLSHVIDVADMLTDGIIAHVPERLSASALTSPKAHFAVRRAWEEHAIWMRVMLLDIAVGSPAAATAKGWLETRQDMMVESLGQTPGARLSDELHARVAIAAELFDAMRTHDAAGVADARARWYANADATGPLLSATNSAPLVERLRADVDRTTAQAESVFGSSSADGLADYDRAIDEAFAIADLLSVSVAHP